MYGVVIEEALKPDDFYREQHRIVFEGDGRALRRGARHRHADARRSPAPDRPARRAGRRGLRPPPRRARPGRRQRPALRADRQGQRAAAAADDRDLRDPGERRQPATASRASSSSAPSGRCSTSPTTIARRTSAQIDEVLHVELDKLQKLSRDGTAAHRHAHRLHGPRRAHRRLPARQPDRDRGPAVDGEELAGHQHGRERRHRRQARRGALLPGDVRDRARPPLHRVPVADPGDELRKGRVGGEPLAQDRWRPAREARAGAALRRRLQRHRRARDPRQGAPAAPARARRARADHRRLPPAHARRRAQSRTASSRSGR